MNFLDKIIAICFICFFSISSLNAFDSNLISQNIYSDFNYFLLNAIAILFILLYIFFRFCYKINQWNKDTTVEDDYFNNT